MQALDPIGIPLAGRHLIEASAGTGKTYTITGLYLRLLLERELSPDKILVVTYTEAACQELREKIRARLASALALFASGHSPDSFLAALHESYRAEGRDLNRLRGLIALALINFDLAAVFTIHGFCMRVLMDSAFESGFPFEMEFVEDDRELLQQVIDDYWRRQAPGWPEVLVAFLCQEGVSPDTLPDLIRLPLRALRIRGEDAFRHGRVRAPQAIDPTLLPRLRELWQGQRAEITSLLLASPALSRSEKGYREDRLTAWFQELDSAFDTGTDHPPLTTGGEVGNAVDLRVPPPSMGGGQGVGEAAIRHDGGTSPPTLALPREGGGDFTRVPPLSALAGLSQGALIEGCKPKKRDQAPSHSFFLLADRLLSELGEARTGLLVELIHHAGPALQALKARSGLVTFDDLLTGVRAGLRAAKGGEALAARVLGQYPVALIDEFQDTDPVQYEIFSRIYGDEGVLFMVGDPKQAIYGFRGADIFSYLEAAKGQGGRGHTLATNWRSEPALIRACNALFGRHAAPFLLPGIDYREVGSPDRARRRLVVEGMDPAVLTLLTFPDVGERKEARIMVARQVAASIRELLVKAGRGEAYFAGDDPEVPGRGRPLGPGDIAILVRNHREGQAVKEALTAAGLTAVTSSRESVFAADEARELTFLLEAVAAPGDERRVRRALATRLLGGEALGLAERPGVAEPSPPPGDEGGDLAAWEGTVERFADYHRRWLTRGVAAMLNHLWAREGVLARLARQVGGERRLTNLRHLQELLQETSDLESLGPAALLRWLDERRRSDRPGEASLLRLESDENLIQIVTVHKSKGLQYPVVYAPFFWDSSFMSTKRAEVAEYHDQEGGLVVDLGSEQVAEARERERRERMAEELRLLYVALTRAENRCLLFWGRVRSGRQRWATASSPLHYLLHGQAASGEELIAGLEEGFAARSPAELLAGFDSIALASAGGVARVETEASMQGVLPIPTAVPALGEARRFRRTLHPYLGLHSFSSLHLSAAEAEEPFPSPPSPEEGSMQSPLALAEGPDHDHAGAGPLPFAKAAPPGLDIFAFPRGAQAGSCLHAIIEAFDFTDKDQETVVAMVREKLTLFGFEPGWTATVMGLLSRLVTTPLDPGTGLRLAEISRQDRLDELEFYYSLPALSDQALRGIFREGGPSGPASGERQALMKGFIDLVFHWQGRYYIVDYKSNYLGPELSDYGQPNLALAMRQSGYDLQYRIYTVALDRYLRRRLAGYDYERHFGGIYYLFLRGLDPTKGPETGVYHARPAEPEVMG